MPRWNSPLVVSVIVTLAYEVVGDLVSQWLRDNAADWVADFVATPWSSLFVLVGVFAAMWVVQMRWGEDRPASGGSAVDSLSPVTDSIDARVVRADSMEGKWQRAAWTFLTWLYRRDEWPGLSQEGRVSEGAPEDYARKRLEHLGLGDLPYGVRKDIGPEPWWEPRTNAGTPEPRETAQATSSATTDNPTSVEGSQDQSQGNHWLPDLDDLTSLTMTNEDLEVAWEAALREAHARLAPDANLHFRRMSLLPSTYVTFHSGSHAAARTASVIVYPDLSTSLFGVERQTDPAYIGRGPFEPEWRRDETWADLIRLSWLRERPFSGSVWVEWIGHGYQSWMPLSEWQVVYERIAADGTKEQTAKYGLVEGRELIEDPRSNLVSLAERFPPPDGQGLV